MPKLLDLLKLYFSHSTLTPDQQNQLTLDLVVLLFAAYVIGWIVNIFIGFKLKSKDVAIELKKQHGRRHSEVCEEIWRQIANINLILPGDANATQQTIDQVKATRKYVHEHSLCLSRNTHQVVDKLLDHLTVCATDYAKKNNNEYIKLLDDFRNAYSKA